MGKAYSSDLAWRVVWRVWDAEIWEEWLPYWLAKEISDPKTGLSVSIHYVNDVWARYWWTGDVETRQGHREAPPANKIFDVDMDIELLKSVSENPRWQMKDHHASLTNLATGKKLSYSTVCAAAWRLYLSRQVIRSLCYKADRDRAVEWLADLLTDYTVWQLSVLDESSKDRSVYKGSFGYALRGHGCMCADLPALSHGSRVSMINLFSPVHGFLDHAFCDGTWNMERFVQVTTEPFVDHTGTLRRPMVLDHMQPGNCLLVDNAKIHGTEFSKDNRFVSRLAARGCQVRFIPPYCWFLSPLDNGAYGRLVQWMRRNAELCAKMPIRDACEMAMQACVSPDDALGIFRHCGYTREA